jgi:hypothetical protein
MKARRSNLLKSQILAVLLWLLGVAVLFAIRIWINSLPGAENRSWMDLLLLLIAYLYFFVLEPLQVLLLGKLNRRSCEKDDSQSPSR